MYIIGGTASKTIAMDLAKILNQPLANVTIKRFPDDELYIRILDKITGEDVVIVQTTYPDQNIIELFLLQDAVREAKAKSITVVAPYFGYGRQDKKFQEGEAISARAIAKLISMNAERFITVDPHKDHVLNFFSISAQSCTALTEVAAYIKTKHIDVVLAPDKGAAERAKNVAKIVGCRYDYLDKTRIHQGFLIVSVLFLHRFVFYLGNCICSQRFLQRFLLVLLLLYLGRERHQYVLFLCMRQSLRVLCSFVQGL